MLRLERTYTIDHFRGVVAIVEAYYDESGMLMEMKHNEKAMNELPSRTQAGLTQSAHGTYAEVLQVDHEEKKAILAHLEANERMSALYLESQFE